MSAETYVMHDLERLSGVQARTLRSWVRLKVLPRPKGRGRAAVYSAQHLLIAQVIRHLRAAKLSLDDIRARIHNASDQQLRAFLPPPARPIDAEGVPLPPALPSYPAVTWDIVYLTDGLCLMVDVNKGPLPRRIAAAIYQHYAMPPRAGS